VLASNSRCISAEVVPKKKIRKRKGRSDASDMNAETKQEKEPRCRRREERSLNNNSFLDEYECSSLALDREEER
ncbi:hypothetical protein Tco_1490100, partial [Tanacetum coccineum]